jgi:hypothetical protein
LQLKLQEGAYDERPGSGASRACSPLFKRNRRVVYVLLAAIAIHAAAALKQQFYDRWRLSGRMPPFHPLGGEEPVIGQGSRARPIEG